MDFKQMIKQNDRAQKKSYKDWIALFIVVMITISTIILIPDRSELIIKTSFDSFKQMILIFPAVLILMGLFSVWTSREFVIDHLGDSSGLKGIVIAFVLGALPTGPLYIAFPMAQALRKKGASYTNIVVFLSAWGCIKIPQELVELQFMGLQFMLARLGLTILFIAVIGMMINRLLKENYK